MTTPSEKRGGRGGRRAGAGRPRTYRRITLDEDTAQELRELLDQHHRQYPGVPMSAAQLVRYLIDVAWIREVKQAPQ